MGLESLERVGAPPDALAIALSAAQARRDADCELCTAPYVDLMQKGSYPTVFAFAVVVASACRSDPASPAKARPAHEGGPTINAAVADAGGGNGETADGNGESTGVPRTKPAPEKSTVTTENLDVAGTLREYVLAVPKDRDGQKAYPLVLVFHADGSSGPGMRSSYTFDAVSGDEAIVAYPTGINEGWDIQTPSATNRDIAFVEKLVTAISTRFKVDLARVFGTGLSSGAFLINKIACRKTGFFRGVVSHAGGAPYEDADPLATRWPNGSTKCAGQTGGIAALIIHGASDGIVPPESGDFDAAYWASINGCQDLRSDTTPAPCKKYEGCPTSQPVHWCLIPGLGHTVWEYGAKEGWAFMKSL